MSHLFSLTPSVKVQRSAFDRSHTYKTTFNAGKLIPFFCDEVLPGDTFNLKASLFCRMATPIVPVMDNLYLETFFFFVPNRIVWNNFQKFMGEQENPGDSIDYIVPVLRKLNRFMIILVYLLINFVSGLTVFLLEDTMKFGTSFFGTRTYRILFRLIKRMIRLFPAVPVIFLMVFLLLIRPDPVCLAVNVMTILPVA